MDLMSPIETDCEVNTKKLDKKQNINDQLCTNFKDKFQHVIKSKKNRDNVIKYLNAKIPSKYKEDLEIQNIFSFLMYEMHVEWSLCPKIEELFLYMKEKNIGLDHEKFNNVKNKIQENDDFISNPPQVEEGVIECSKCKSKRTISFSKQTRSGDEACTVFVRCAECHYQFRM